jgi:hypothetical protein
VHRVSTGPLLVYGGAMFVTGLMVLAAAGTRYPIAVYGWIVLLAVAVAVPVGLVGLLAASVERASGRAWLSGARRLEMTERTSRPTVERGARYASWIWLANGLALWVATVASQFAG